MQPLLSVIIPVFNTEKYLQKCLDSIINQSLAYIEILVINDCSEGDTDSVMAKYANNTKVKYLKLDKNVGLGASRNIGIRKATGKFIAFCDSDDWVDLFLYESMVSALEKTKSDIAICGIIKEFPDGEQAVIKANFEKEIAMDADTAFRILTYQYSVGITITPSAGNKMIRKSFLEEKGIDFLEKVYYEDLYFSFKALLSASKVVCVPKYFYHYFRRNNSIIISISRYHIDSFFHVFKQLKDFLLKRDLFDQYKYNYYQFGERFYNLILRQIFEFATDDVTKKKLLEYSVELVKKLVTTKEFFEYASAEKLRRHLQPYMTSTKII